MLADRTNQKSKSIAQLNMRKLTLARDELGNFTKDQVQMMKDIKILEITENLNGIKGNTTIKMDISDIINGVSEGKIIPGIGHNESYWTKHKMQPVEFFAEASSSMINNHESLNLIKKLFPKAFDEYLTVVEVIANGSTKKRN